MKKGSDALRLAHKETHTGSTSPSNNLPMLTRLKKTYNRIKKTLGKCLNILAFKIKPTPMVLSSEDSLRYILENKISVSRFGDGEIFIISGAQIGFQVSNPILQQRLAEVLRSNSPGHKVAIPDVFGSLSRFTPMSRDFWEKNGRYNILYWMQYINGKQQYLDALISRFYIDYLNTERSTRIIKLWKDIWNQKKIIIVEGHSTGLGHNNDLFDNAASISRILCPPKNAFEQYERILSAIRQHTSPDELVLIALGPTATVLAYDLSQQGIWAIDTGHLDIEYEWFLARAQSKIEIKNKDINELGSFKESDSSTSDDDFRQQVIVSIS